MLVSHDATLKKIIQELTKSREERGQLEEQMMELTEQVTSLNSQVKGKGKQSNPTPEPSAAGGVGGGGNGDPPEHFGAGAPGGSDDGDDDDDDDEDYDRRKGRNDKTPANKERRDKRPAENERTEEENRFSSILSAAMAETSKRPAEPPNTFTNAGHEDIRFWLTRCQDYFDRNKLQWREESDRIKYTLGKIQGATVTPFAMAYRNQMTGELGYTRQEGYDRWEIFKEQVIRGFGPTHEDVKALQELYQISYKGVIDEFLQQIQSNNNRAKVTGLAFRKIVDDQVPEEAIRRMSMQQEYIDDREWLRALRKAVKDEEDLKERRKLKANSFGTVAQKRKAPEQATAMVKKPKYTAKEKRVYHAAKKEEAKVKKETAAPRNKIIHRVWKTAQEGIDQKQIDERNAKGQCTRCTLNNHGWKHCEKEIRISAAR